MSFSRWAFFYETSSLVLSENLLKRSFRCFYPRKIKNVIWFSIIKISAPTHFMRLRLKLTTEIGILNGKMTRNRLKMYFIIFFSKNRYLKKYEKLYFIFYYKNRNTSQFLVFMIKNDFKNVSESGEFRFENSLKTYIFNFMLELQWNFTQQQVSWSIDIT